MKIEIKKEKNKSIKLLRNYSNYESKNQKGNIIFKIEYKLTKKKQNYKKKRFNQNKEKHKKLQKISTLTHLSALCACYDRWLISWI